MRMINRMIEPSEGRIFLDGEDVTSRNVDELRRQVGYVIQQVGLFPHMTIAENVATVPKMLKWDKRRITARVDEMLDLVGLDPSTYRSRYPKQLSGGQQQRVGVARALCADPPVMLMDEPFGAIDPISRERLQNEFLRLQAELRKTIVFVTHDVNEAIKMGDRIVILRERSQIAQYDTPEAILAAPADDFVRDFIGSGAALRRLDLAVLEPAHLEQWPVVGAERTTAEALEALARSARPAVLIATGDGRRDRWATAEQLRQAGDLATAGTPAGKPLPLDSSLADVLDELLRAQSPAVVIAGPGGAPAGMVDVQTVVRAAGNMHRTAGPAAAGDAPDGPSS
jgi:osmoprotectant transport system ATP-binding protein